jgi:hypothetical protein
VYFALSVLSLAIYVPYFKKTPPHGSVAKAVTVQSSTRFDTSLKCKIEAVLLEVKLENFVRLYS